MKKEFKTGEPIKIEGEDFIRLLSGLKNKEDAIKIMITELSEMNMNVQKEIFELIERKYPELEKYQYSYNHEKGIVTIMHKKD